MGVRSSFLLGLFLLICTISFHRATMSDSEEKTKEVVVEFSPDMVQADEMNAFLSVWSEYMHSKVNQKFSAQLSLSNNEIPEKLKKWLQKRGWDDADRFFYVEQRLVSIVKTIYLQKHAESMIKVWEKQLQQEKDKQVIAGIKKAIADQQKIVMIENVSQPEIDMVKPNFDKISQILEGKDVYHP